VEKKKCHSNRLLSKDKCRGGILVTIQNDCHTEKGIRAKKRSESDVDAGRGVMISGREGVQSGVTTEEVNGTQQAHLHLLAANLVSTGLTSGDSGRSERAGRMIEENVILLKGACWWQ